MSKAISRAGSKNNFIAFVLGAGLLATAGTFVHLASASNTIRRSSDNYLLANLKTRQKLGRAVVAAPEPQVLATALKSQPLSPIVVNAAIFANAASIRNSSVQDERVDLLANLGWRSTLALQNRIFDAVERQDLKQIVTIGDALLRRDELVDQSRALMNLMELSPATRGQLADALSREPSWRVSYFQSFGALTTLSQAQARGQLADDLKERNSPLSRVELLPTLQLMVSRNLTGPAYGLWRDYRGLKSNQLVNDTDFSWAYRTRNDSLSDMPFEWQMPTGSGFWTELVRDGANQGVVIQWGRKGVPDFMLQLTYIPSPAEQYVLEIEGKNLPSNLDESLAFTWRCQGSTVRFSELVERSANRIALRADSPLRCTSPVFAVSGRPRQFGTSTSARSSVGLGDELSVTITQLRVSPARGGATAFRGELHQTAGALVPPTATAINRETGVRAGVTVYAGA